MDKHISESGDHTFQRFEGAPISFKPILTCSICDLFTGNNATNNEKCSYNESTYNIQCRGHFGHGSWRRETGVHLETQLIKSLCLDLASAQTRTRHSSTCATSVSSSSALSANSDRQTMGLDCIAAILVPILFISSPVSTWPFTLTRQRGSPIRSAIRYRGRNSPFSPATKSTQSSFRCG